MIHDNRKSSPVTDDDDLAHRRQRPGEIGDTRRHRLRREEGQLAHVTDIRPRNRGRAPTRNPPVDPASGNCLGGVVGPSCSDGTDAGGLRALRALADLELHPLVLLEGAKAGPLDLRVVDKHVRRPVFGCDEAEALLGVEPLHRSLWHLSIFPYSSCPVRCTFGRGTGFRCPGPVAAAVPLWCRSVLAPTSAPREPRPQPTSCESLTRTQKL